MCNVISLYFLCCSVNGAVCLVGCVCDNVCELLVKQFSICLDVVVILLWKCLVWVEVLCWIDRVWSSKECACCACDPSVHLSVPSIYFVFVCRKLSPHLRAGSQVCSPYVVSLCDFAYYVVG